jgi:3-dehydroquinate synthase
LAAERFTGGAGSAERVRERSHGTTGTRRTVRVELGERSYSIEIGFGILGEVGEAIRRRTGATRAMVVTVPPVGRRYAPTVMRSLGEAGIRARRFGVPDGEGTKSLRQASSLYDAFLDAGADRATLVIALGGGVVGDLAGFVAATLLRGIPVVQVPTSLLAMVDSSVGGKTGVNVARGKNLVGAFHQPRLVWMDASTLRTLPDRELAAGMAELIKHAAIRDEGFFEWLEAELERVVGLELLIQALERSCAIKADVVGRDERESGLRMILNFGHTVGHAVEALKRFRGILHGEAVAIGMVFAAQRSESLGLSPSGTSERLAALLRRAGLPTELPVFPRRAYLQALRVDKKKREERIRFVALRGIGKAETVPLLPREIMPPLRGKTQR